MEHISKSYLSRRFRRQTGMSVIRYVNRLRVEASKRLLIGSKLRVNEIAYQVGFESPKYFYRVFKAAAGASPAAYPQKLHVGAHRPGNDLRQYRSI
ncbi:MAG: helix-turn-helix transcriptional regulator [Oscillospiraceae bacterium]